MKNEAVIKENGENLNRIFEFNERWDLLQIEIDKYYAHFKKNHGRYLSDSEEGPRYSFIDLILEVYRVHTLDDTVIIVNQVLKYCGYPSSDWAIKNYINKMFNGTIFPGNIHYNPNVYKLLMITIKKAHEEGEVIPPIYSF